MYQQIIDTIFSKTPILFLGSALILMFFVGVPAANHDAMISIISGFLGLLTGRALSQPTPSKPDATPPAQDPQP